MYGHDLVDFTGLDCLGMVCICLNMLELAWLIFVGLCE